MSRKLVPLSDTEMQVLKVLWEHGPATVRQLNGRLAKWAYTTVQTLLGRLADKGYVAKDSSGFAHVYRPIVSRDMLLRRRLDDLTQQLCDGAASPAVLALVEEHPFSTEEIEQFRQLLDRLEAERGDKSRRRKSSQSSAKTNRKRGRGTT